MRVGLLGAETQYDSYDSGKAWYSTGPRYLEVFFPGTVRAPHVVSDPSPRDLVQSVACDASRWETCAAATASKLLSEVLGEVLLEVPFTLCTTTVPRSACYSRYTTH